MRAIAIAFLVAAAGASLAGCRVRHQESTSSTAAQLPGSLRFVDVTQPSGVRFRYVRASSGRKYFVETMGGAVAVLDYDNDGRQDLFFPNGAALPGFRPTARLLPALYRNLGGGRFEETTRRAGLAIPSYGMGCAVGDYDNDGFDDLYVTAVLGPCRLFRNLGDGRFEDVTTRAGVNNRNRFGTSAAWLDFDRDGDLDLFVCNYVRYGSVKDDLPCYFKAGVRSYCIPFAYTAEPNTLYRNDGNGRFVDVSRRSGVDRPAGKSLGVAVADYDRDGWPDLIIANDTTPTQLYRNNQDGTFSEQAAALGIAYGPSGSAKAGMGIDVADDRNNGAISVAMGNFSAEMVGYYQFEDGFFEERSIESGLGQPSRSFLTFGTLFLDVDNDGWKDLFLANGHVQDNVGLFHDDVAYRQRPLLFRNLGGARYTEVGGGAGEPFGAPIVARGAARCDLDDDGRVDLVVAPNIGPVQLWRNETTPSGHWLRVRLRGVRSNRNGYGAKVSIRTGRLRQEIEHSSGGSYLSASDQRLHFGVGGATRIDELTVQWPSGTVETLRGLPVDRELTIVEGSPAQARAR